MDWTLSVYICVLFLFGINSHGVKFCRLPGVSSGSGRCLPIEQCTQTYNKLLLLQLQANPLFMQYLEELICDRGPTGHIFICCGDEPHNSNTINGQRSSRARKTCMSSHGGQGACVPLESCSSLYNCSMKLHEHYNPSLHLHLTQHFCYQENGVSYVCCEEDSAASWKPKQKLGWQVCQTPFLDAGRCVPPNRCALVEDSERVPEVFNAFMVGCAQPNNVRHMCCPDAGVQYDTKVGSECTVLAGEPGYCTESDRCADFMKASNRLEYLRNNWCYTTLDQVDYVCCAKQKILKVPQQAININSRAGEDGPTCTTPDRKPGRCVSLAQCTPIATILRQAANAGTAVSPTQATFLRSSICTPEGTTNSSYYVCCDETALQPNTTSAPVSATAKPMTVSSEITDHPNLKLFDRTTCGRPNLDDKIAYGEMAPMYQYPWMAMLIYRSISGQEGPECGGTVINSRYVLTAAHCIEGQIDRLLYVRLGEYDTRTDPDCDEYQECAPPFQRYTVEEYIVHPNFTRTVRTGNDIGLLRLDRDVDSSNGDILPICLPFTAVLIRFDPTLYWITGWGLTERLENSPILLQTRIPSVACSLDSRLICAGFRNGTLHCRGDSGGPLKVQVPEFSMRYVQYGIISAGPGCGVVGVTGVSTRVAFFVRWILDNVRE